MVGVVSCYMEVDSNGREIARNLSTSVFKASMSWCKKDLPEWNSNEMTKCVSTMAARGVSSNITFLSVPHHKVKRKACILYIWLVMLTKLQYFMKCLWMWQWTKRLTNLSSWEQEEMKNLWWSCCLVFWQMGKKLPPCKILRRKTVPKESFHRGSS